VCGQGLNLSYFTLACACVFVHECVCMCLRECVDKGSIYHILPLRVRVCLCVCMFACVCVSVWTRAQSIIFYPCVCVCVCAYVCVYTCVCECVDKGSIYHILPLRAYVCLCVCMCVYVCVVCARVYFTEVTHVLHDD